MLSREGAIVALIRDLTLKPLIVVLRIFRLGRIEPEQARTGESGERSGL